jgi:hypothetical protein
LSEQSSEHLRQFIQIGLGRWLNHHIFFFAHLLHRLFQKSAVLAIKLAGHAGALLTIDVLGGVDNLLLDFTLAALRSRRICFSVL